jgi:hypothetical protein
MLVKQKGKRFPFCFFSINAFTSPTRGEVKNTEQRNRSAKNSKNNRQKLF